jgi:hypothetical protein
MLDILVQRRSSGLEAIARRCLPTGGKWVSTFLPYISLVASFAKKAHSPVSLLPPAMCHPGWVLSSRVEHAHQRFLLLQLISKCREPSYHDEFICVTFCSTYM